MFNLDIKHISKYEYNTEQDRQCIIRQNLGALLQTLLGVEKQ
jgi:hypothetical protein